MPKQVVGQQLLARPACTPLGAANCEVLEVLLLAGRAPADVPGNGGPPFWSHCGASSDGSGSMHCRRPPALSQSAPPLCAGSQCCVPGSGLPPGAAAAARGQTAQSTGSLWTAAAPAEPGVHSLGSGRRLLAGCGSGLPVSHSRPGSLAVITGANASCCCVKCAEV